MESLNRRPPPLATCGSLGAAGAEPVGADEREHRRGAGREQEARKGARARHLRDGQAAREHAVERRQQAPDVVVAERARHQRVQAARTQVVHTARKVALHKVQHLVPCLFMHIHASVCSHENEIETEMKTKHKPKAERVGFIEDAHQNAVFHTP